MHKSQFWHFECKLKNWQWAHKSEWVRVKWEAQEESVNLFFVRVCPYATPSVITCNANVLHNTPSLQFPFHVIKLSRFLPRWSFSYSEAPQEQKQTLKPEESSWPKPTFCSVFGSTADQYFHCNSIKRHSQPQLSALREGWRMFGRIGGRRNGKGTEIG